MKAARISADEVLALRPCWDETALRRKAGKRGKTPTEIACDKKISIADRRWVLTRLLARTDTGRRRLVLWAAGCAADVLDKAVDYDAAACAIALATAWSEGVAVSRDELSDAADAAYAAYAADLAAAADVAYAAAAAADAAYAANAAYADAATIAATRAAYAAYAAYATAATVATAAAVAYAEKHIKQLAAYLTEEFNARQ